MHPYEENIRQAIEAGEDIKELSSWCEKPFIPAETVGAGNAANTSSKISEPCEK